MTDPVSYDFQETEVGYFPPEWEVLTLGELESRKWIRIKNGFACGSHNQNGVGIPHIRPFNVSEEGRADIRSIKFIGFEFARRDCLLHPGDIVFNNTNSEELVGKTAYWDLDGEYTLSNHMTFIRVVKEDEIDPFFLAKLLHKYWFNGYYAGICRRHVNQASVSLARLQAIPVALPPLPEQRRIAHVLSTIQRAIQAQDAVIAAARELKRSLMHRLFTYGPYAGPLPTKETEIGEVPEAWEVLNLGSLSKMVRYGTSTRCSDEVHGLPVLRIPNVIDGVIDLCDLKYADLPSAEVQRLSLQDGDLLFVRTNGQKNNIGRSAVFHHDLQAALFASYLICVRLDQNVANPDFVNNYLATDAGRAQMIGMASGAADGKFNINSQTIRSLLVPIPPKAKEQQEIVQLINVVSVKAGIEEQRKAALDALFKSMLYQLMAGQVRVPPADFGSRRP